MHKKEYSSSLFRGQKALDCDSISSDDVINRYIQTYGPLDWLNSKKAGSLAEAVLYASRYNAPDRYRLISKVLLQALEYGPDYVLGRVSKDARNMFNRSRRVCMEAHRANGFIRLTPVENPKGSFMVGKAEFRHDICDLVLRYFSRRHQGWKIYLISGNTNTEQAALTGQTACYLEKNVVKTVPVSDLPFELPGDDFERLWETYYESQYIEGRKNLALARKHLPQKYWSWVPEGNKLK